MSTDLAPIAGFVLAVAVLLHFVPLWRRQRLWFAVTVPAGFSDTQEARGALRRYRTIVWTVSAAAAAALVGGTRPGLGWLAALGMFVQAAGATVAFAVVHRQVRRYGVAAPTIRWIEIPAVRERLPGGLWSVVAPVTLLLGAALVVHLFSDRLPDRWPIDRDADGVPERWVDRTWRHTYGPIAMGAIVALFQIAMAYVILRGSPSGREPGTEAWTRRFRRAVLRLLVAGVWFVAAMMCALALGPLVTGGPRPGALGWIVPVALLAWLVPLAVQILWLMRDQSSGTDGTPDDRWKLGLFYFNPDDPAVMVEKRFGVGYTLNFGNRGLWWILGAGVLAFLVILTVLPAP
ncbi:MAG TPA: DUF5808 domain-containing protein [Vicinamibacterales bacterium]|jgi:uncharacterized membrane protein